MAKNIVVERVRGTDVEKQMVEIVERKGLGHPDFMADSIAETYSQNLSRYYLDNFGKILHHNVDKLEVIGGRTAPAFGGGRVLTPISILFSGRATETVDEARLPIRDIATRSAEEWLDRNMRFIDLNSVRYIFETKSGSANLSNIYQRMGVFSNDTSFGASFAPLSPTENIVLEMENVMSSWEFKYTFPYSGEDVKILAVRTGKSLDVTIANAFVDKYLPDIGSYFEKKQKLLDELVERVRFMIPSDFTSKVSLNALDDRNQGKDGCYLTVTGTSAEHGDDGAVGRGNRVNGLITPNRVMSFEAIAGKNPVNHIGKIYNILAKHIANDIYDTIGKAVTVKIVGKIGEPIDEPLVTVVTFRDATTTDEKRRIRQIVDEHLCDVENITMKLIEGKISIC